MSLRIIKFSLVILVSGSMYPALSQQTIRGIVVDSASFAPLPYVSIQVKSGMRGTSTDTKGNFGIFAAETDTLVFSLLGYERLELPLAGYEPSLIRMVEKATELPMVTIDDYRLDNVYEGMFEEGRPARLKQGMPFYYSRGRKDKVMAGRWRENELRVQTYLDVVVNNPDTKAGLMKLHDLTEKEYYDILTRFNEKHHQVMYFLTAAELMSFLNRFFEQEMR